MAHSLVRNAGQKYASARKQGKVSKSILDTLKAAAVARPLHDDSTGGTSAQMDPMATLDRIAALKGARRNNAIR